MDKEGVNRKPKSVSRVTRINRLCWGGFAFLGLRPAKSAPTRHFLVFWSIIKCMKKLFRIFEGVALLVLISIFVYVSFFNKAEAPQGWQTYSDSVSGITLQAPVGLTVATSTSGLSLIFATTTPYVHTHLLHELRIDIATPAVDCVSTEGDYVGVPTNVAVNGVVFERQEWDGVGAGNLYRGIDYTAVKGGSCYRVSLFIHSTNGEGFYTNDAEQIKKVDAQQAADIKALFAFFDQIIETVRFTK